MQTVAATYPQKKSKVQQQPKQVENGSNEIGQSPNAPPFVLVNTLKKMSFFY